jgi:polyisoprenoid-binding protein YceI
LTIDPLIARLASWQNILCFVEKFRKMKFTAGTLVDVDKKGHYELFGELTMTGIRKQIKLDVQLAGLYKGPWGTEKALFGKINRKDSGLNWNAVWKRVVF